METHTSVFQADVGQKHDWRQSWAVPNPDPTQGDYFVLLDGGIVIISIFDNDGAEKWWNGTAFASATEVQLVAPVEAGSRRVRYPFTVPVEARGRTVHMRGWVHRNGSRSPRHDAYLEVGFRSRATLAP